MCNMLGYATNLDCLLIKVSRVYCLWQFESWDLLVRLVFDRYEWDSLLMAIHEFVLQPVTQYF